MKGIFLSWEKLMSRSRVEQLNPIINQVIRNSSIKETSKYEKTILLRMVNFFSYVPNLIFCEAKVFMVDAIHKYLI